MTHSRLPRCIAAAAVGIAAACFSFSAIADSPVTVTFQANNPWVQEVGSVDRDISSHDYSVQVASGKTLQINLVTRDPNVFFKVRDQTGRKQLVDTLQTGATTWSTPVAAAATYTIHVYVDPEAMQRGEVAQYALQIGQYGPEDMQVATTTVTFQGNNPWAQEVSSVDSDATAHNYTVAIAAGRTLQVNLITSNHNVHFKVEDQTHGNKLVDTSETGTTTWSMPVATATTYTIQVYADPAALPPGQQAQYALQIGQFASVGTQPAAPGTAAQAAASPTPATSATTPASAASNH